MTERWYWYLGTLNDFYLTLNNRLTAAQAKLYVKAFINIVVNLGESTDNDNFWYPGKTSSLV